MPIRPAPILSVGEHRTATVILKGNYGVWGLWLTTPCTVISGRQWTEQKDTVLRAGAATWD